MTPPAESIPLWGFAPALAIDLVAIALLAYGVYFRRHARRDLLTAPAQSLPDLTMPDRSPTLRP